MTSPLALTATREMRETVRHKTFWIVNAVLFVGALAAVTIPSLIHSSGGTDTVAIVDVPAGFQDALHQARSSGNTTVKFVPTADRSRGAHAGRQR